MQHKLCIIALNCGVASIRKFILYIIISVVSPYIHSFIQFNPATLFISSYHLCWILSTLLLCSWVLHVVIYTRTRFLYVWSPILSFLGTNSFYYVVDFDFALIHIFVLWSPREIPNIVLTWFSDVLPINVWYFWLSCRSRNHMWQQAV